MTVVPMICGNCGLNVSANVMLANPPFTADSDLWTRFDRTTLWLMCPSCFEGSVKVKNGGYFPVGRATREYGALPDDVAEAWKEAGLAHAAQAYTAAEMMCRKILMHVAVDKAASAPGKSFASYIDDLETAGLIIAGLKPVVDQIRLRGNAAIHELPSSTQSDSLQTIQIVDHLLKSVYVLPGLAASP